MTVIDPPHRAKGEPFKCENGHVMCHATEDIMFGDSWIDKMGHWKPGIKHALGQPDPPKCPVCDADIVIYYVDGKPFNGMMKGNQI